MDFEKTCMLFTMQEPFYGILLSAMERIPTNKIDTAGVGRSGNVFKLYYNPNYVNSLSLDGTLALLRHEVLHVAFNHFNIWDIPDSEVSEEEHNIRNIAADMEVNCYIDVDRISDCKTWIKAREFGFEKCLGTREYYKKLREQQREQAMQPQTGVASASVCQPCNGGQSNNSQQQTSGAGTSGNKQQNKPKTPKIDETKPFDSHDMWPSGSKSDMEVVSQAIDELVAYAAEETEKACGVVPSEMKMRIEQIKKKPKPAADWKRYCRRYLGNEFTEFIRKSKKRESRRFPDAAGNRHRRKSHILVGIDTSGSISMREYKEFFGQLRTLTAQCSFRVLECDADIQHEYEFVGIIPEQVHGGGGTSFQPIIDYFIKYKKKYDALIYFTDGYADIPKNTPKDTLWVISSGGDKSERNRYRVNGASVVFIPKSDE